MNPLKMCPKQGFFGSKCSPPPLINLWIWKTELIKVKPYKCYDTIHIYVDSSHCPNLTFLHTFSIVDSFYLISWSCWYHKSDIQYIPWLIVIVWLAVGVDIRSNCDNFMSAEILLFRDGEFLKKNFSLYIIFLGHPVLWYNTYHGW